MAKYDNQIIELKNLLPNANNILITLPLNSDIDRFASGLSLFLALKQAGKNVNIASDITVLVAQSHLFGIQNVQKNIPDSGSGNYILTLEGVAIPDSASPNGWKVPALENLDWYGENNNLNLVFHVLPGQTFQPTNIVPRPAGGGFDLIFTIGAAGLNNLGSLYLQNTKTFEGNVINIDNQAGNLGFGKTNVLDPQSPTISEMIADLIPSFGLSLDADIASNLLSGIFDATSNLTKEGMTADTFMAVANLLRAGGKKPGVVQQPQPIQSQPVQPQPTQGFDLSVLMPSNDSFPVPPVATGAKLGGTPSPEERPSMEGIASAETIEPEPGWLTPKVFKGSAS